MRLVQKAMISGGAILAAATVALATGMTSATATSFTTHPYVTTHPYLTSVSLAGSSASPTVTIKGRDFGGQPTDGVAVSSLADCQSLGFTPTGQDYPAQLWLADPTAFWIAGTYDNSSYGNCVGIIISSWSRTKVVFTFGSAYGTQSWTLNDGDGYAVSVRGSGGYQTVPSGF